MDPVVLSTLIAGGIGCVISWGMIIGFYLIVQSRRWKQDNRSVDQSAFEPRFGSAVCDWYRVWAWKPVHTVDRGWIWLRPYWRRNIQRHAFLDGGPDFWWQNVVTLRYIEV